MSDRPIEKAVILAAGSGNRISSVMSGTPKPLLPLDGRPGSPTFLDWHVAALAKSGTQAIYIVGNRATLGAPLRPVAGVRVEWIANPTEDLSTSGSAHSAWFAWRSAHGILDGRSRVLLMDADVLYDPALLGLLASARGDRSKTLVSTIYEPSDEEVLVFAEPTPHAPLDSSLDSRVPRLHGKGLLGTPLAESLTCLGEATGILLWEPADHARLAAVTDWTIRFSTAKARSEHEDLTQRMMALERVRAVSFTPSNEAYGFMEVDTPAEYRVMVEELYPRLRGDFGRP